VIPPTALYFARDPGSANQLVAALAIAVESGVRDEPGAAFFREAVAARVSRHLVLAYGPAARIFADAGVGVTAPTDEMMPAGPRADRENAFGRYFHAHNVVVVVTGTSDLDEDLDRVLWAAARRAGILSHVFLDHPANLRLRFTENDGSIVLPDHLYAPDAGYAALLAESGLRIGELRVTGPLHADLIRKKRTSAEAKRNAIRRAWGADTSDSVVLFASECGREMARLGRPAPYDELRVLEDLSTSLAREPGRSRTILVVRPHPRDSEGKYDEWLRHAPREPRCLVSGIGTATDAIVAADSIVGMDSTMLREARFLGRPATSLVGADISL